MEAVVLAGGLGTRFAGALPGIAKVLAPVKGRPFLDYVFDYLVSQEIRRIVVCVGHLQEQVIDRYQGFTGADLRFSREFEPLGTGGAVRRAVSLLESDPFIALNGDSICRVQLSGLVLVHREHAAQATLALARPDTRTDVGNVLADADSRVVAFTEKAKLHAPGTERFVNAGVYAFSKSAFADFVMPSFSLERDLLPRLVKARTCYGVPTPERLVDIGTPERYEEAQRLL